MKRHFWSTAVVTLLGLWGAAVAAEEGKKAVIMDEVVVTATKTEETRKNVSNSIIIIEAADIAESPARSLGELLANHLGMDWRTYGGYGGAAEEIHIRGMGGDGTQVFINGINVNSPSLAVADVSKIPLDRIERIEIVKGAGSLLYGSGAMGGTVNIKTKGPRREGLDLKVQGGYGSQDTYQVSAGQGTFLGERFGYYVTASRRETDGFRENSDLTHKDVSLKLLYDLGDVLEVTLYGDYVDRDYGRPGAVPPQGTEAFYYNGKKVYGRDAASVLNRGGDEDGRAVLHVKSKLNKWLSLNFRTDYAHMENYDHTRYYDSFAGGVPGQETWTTNEVLGLEGDVDIRPFTGATILIGGEYKDYRWKNETVTLDGSGNRESGSFSKAEATLDTKGLFAEAQYRPCKYFKALAGIRHENHSTFGGEDIPRYGIIINPHDTTVLKLSRGKHYKAPTPNDLFWPYEDWGWGMGTQGNPDLRPETGWHTEATLEQTLFDEKMLVTASYFTWDIRDKIRWVADQNYFYTPQNLATYEADGWELGTRIGPFYNLLISLDYTKTDAKEIMQGGTKRQALYTPDYQFKGSLTHWTGFGLTTVATVRFVGERPGHYDSMTDTEPSKMLDSYWTLDLKLEQRLFDHWIFTLSGNNLFDKAYDTYAENFYDSTGRGTLSTYPGAGRSVFFSVAYEY
ncbi:MAG: TonB-dependent receptor plug domain-containing protein [Desulfatiglandales bacterium]